VFRARLDSKIVLVHRRKSSEWSRTYLRVLFGKSNRRLQPTRASPSIAWNKYFSTDFEEGILPRQGARRLTLHSRARATIPFYQIPTDLRNRSVRLNCKRTRLRGSLSGTECDTGTRSRIRSRSLSTGYCRRVQCSTTKSVPRRVCASSSRHSLSLRGSPLQDQRHLEFNHSVCLSYE